MGLFDSVGKYIPAIVPSIGSALLGGILDQKEHAKNRSQADQEWQRNYDMQKEFAQHGLRWKVEDAKAAGIHPLAAMGASGYSASPVTTGVGPDYSMGNMVRSMGQDVTRAMMTKMTEGEREYIQTKRNLELDNLRLHNKLLDGQYIKMMEPEEPPMPEPISQMVYNDRTGTWDHQPSPSNAMASQGDFSMGLRYPIRNRLMPFLGDRLADFWDMAMPIGTYKYLRKKYFPYEPVTGLDVPRGFRRRRNTEDYYKERNYEKALNGRNASHRRGEQ